MSKTKRRPLPQLLSVVRLDERLRYTSGCIKPPEGTEILVNALVTRPGGEQVFHSYVFSDPYVSAVDRLLDSDGKAGDVAFRDAAVQDAKRGPIRHFKQDYAVASDGEEPLELACSYVKWNNIVRPSEVVLVSPGLAAWHAHAKENYPDNTEENVFYSGSNDAKLPVAEFHENPWAGPHGVVVWNLKRKSGDRTHRRVVKKGDIDHLVLFPQESPNVGRSFDVYVRGEQAGLVARMKPASMDGLMDRNIWPRYKPRRA